MKSNSTFIFESSLLCFTSNSGRGFLLFSWISFWNLRRILITEHCDYLSDLSSDLDKYSFIASDMWHLFCVQRREMVTRNNDPWSVLLISMIFFFHFGAVTNFFFSLYWYFLSPSLFHSQTKFLKWFYIFFIYWYMYIYVYCNEPAGLYNWAIQLTKYDRIYWPVIVCFRLLEAMCHHYR